MRLAARTAAVARCRHAPLAQRPAALPAAPSIGACAARQPPPHRRAVAASATPPSDDAGDATPSLDKAARSSETQAVNLRAVAPADAAGAAAASFAKAIGADRPRADAAARRLVLGDDQSEEKWRQLDERVNEYPDRRVFKGIGVAGADAGLFRRAIVAAVESVVGTVDDGAVSMRDSSGGKYVSVTVGPVVVQSGDDVVAIYAAMKELAGPMLKFYI